MNKIGAQYLQARGRWGTHTVNDWWGETSRDGEKWLEQSHYVKSPATTPKGKRRVVVDAAGNVAGPLEPGVGLMTASQEWESVARGIGYVLVMWDALNSPAPDPAEVAQYDEKKRKEQVAHYNQKRRERRQFVHNWIKQNYPGFFEAHYRPPTHSETTAPEMRGLPGDNSPLPSAPDALGREAQAHSGTPERKRRRFFRARKTYHDTPDKLAALKEEAQLAGISENELIRRSVDESIADRRARRKG